MNDHHDKNIFVDKSNISFILTHTHDDEFYIDYIYHMTKRREKQQNTVECKLMKLINANICSHDYN